jgi:carbonic anhydrase
MDYRLQRYLNDWLDANYAAGKYDRVAIAGGVLDMAPVLKHVELAVRLHKIRRVVLINHEGCGAYGAEGTFMRHKTDLDEARRKILEKVSNLVVERYYLHLDGKFEQLD